MGDCFIGEIRLFPYYWGAPKGWALCNGTILPVSQNPALYALLGNTYGGQQPTTFALPDLRGRTPLNVGDIREMGNCGGLEYVSINLGTLPPHRHLVQCSTEDAATPFAEDAFPACVVSPSGDKDTNVYGGLVNTTTLNTECIDLAAGQETIHNNMQPFLALNFCIATAGIFPPRS